MPAYLSRGMISAVNFTEIVQSLHRSGRDPASHLHVLDASGLRFIDADRRTAQLAGDLERATKPWGMSLADRFCLALALLHKSPIVTADKPFAKIGMAAKVILLR